MSDAARAHVSAMEGKGAYNKHAAIPAAGGSLAVPLLEAAAQQISLDSSDRPIVIADYGSSQGKNSLAPMRAAIAALRTRVGRQRPILVCHTDLPANDFSEMFALLESDPENIGACSRPVTSISDGVPTPRSGSAGFRVRSPTASSSPVAPAPSGPSSIAKLRRTGRLSCRCGPPSCA
jgi:hypothetical protein